MFDELLPPLRRKAEIASAAWEVASDLEALWRVAVVAGRTERRLVDEAKTLSNQRILVITEAKTTDPYGNEVVDHSAIEAETRRLSQALERLDRHLERKIM